MFCFTTQRHMQVHFAIMALTLLAAWGLDVTQTELIQLLTAMIFVLIAEMANTAIEYTVDIATESYDPRAKVAKDVAAGMVLLAAAYSLVIAGLVFAGNQRLAELLRDAPPPAEPNLGPVQVVVIGAMVLGIVISYLKKRTRRGTFWRGGIVSGHTALGFMVATSIAIVTRDAAVTALGLALAILVSQSRIQARIHSPLEVVIGGIMGTLVAFVLFMWP